jgi:hypothetical protein
MRRPGEYVGDVKSSTPMLLALDGDEHAQRRKVVAPLFGPRAIARWGEHARAVGGAHLRACGSGDVPFGESIVRPSAVAVALAWLGLDDTPPARCPPGRAADLVRLAAAVFDADASPRRRQLAAARLERAVRQTLASSSSHDPATLVGLQPPLHEDDATAAAMSMLTVGVELGARAMLAIVVHGAPREWNRLREYDDRALDAVLGASGIISTTERIVSNSEELPEALHDCRAGDTLALQLAGATATGVPLTFGLGMHHCLGAAWTRMLCRALLDVLAGLDLRVDVVDVVAGGSGFGGPSEVIANVRHPGTGA